MISIYGEIGKFLSNLNEGTYVEGPTNESMLVLMDHSFVMRLKDLDGVDGHGILEDDTIEFDTVCEC